jgi:porphobilinogen deaminase
MIEGLEGGCQIPIADHAILGNGALFPCGLVGATDGSSIPRAVYGG